MTLLTRPRLIHWHRHCLNGHSPSATLWRDLIAAQNHAVAYGARREVYRKAIELGTDVTGATAMASRWRFKTGYGVDRVRIVMLMGRTATVDGIGVQVNPTSTVAIGATSATFSYGASPVTATDAPDECMVMSEDVTVTSDTVYECQLSNAELARPLAIMVHELGPTTVSESTDGMNAHSPVAGSPIYDANRQRMLVGLSNLYLDGGITWHWSLWDETARTRTSATFINLIDDSETGTPTAASYGVYLNPQYHNTQSRTTVPFQLGVYGSMAAGTGTVRLIDTAGNTYCSTSINSSTPQWFTATGNLPASETFYALQFAGDGAAQLSVQDVSLIETE